MKHVLKNLLFAVAVVFSTAVLVESAVAQSGSQSGTIHKVSGTVTDIDSGEPLPGVNVIAAGTAIGTTTNADGHYLIETRSPVKALTFSFVGYRAVTREVASGSAVEMNVQMQESRVDLQPVIVSAARGAQARNEAPIAIDALTSAQLEESKPSMLFQALNQVPGVYMANLGAEQHVMSIRQPLQYKALYVYMEDGMPIRSPGIFNHNALIEINMAAIDRVEVIRGPASALYGSNAVGGAINFITPTASRTPSGEVTLRRDNYGYGRGDFKASTTFGKLGVFAGGYVARQRDGFADQTDFDKLSLTFRGDYAFNTTTMLTATVTTNHLDTDTRGSLDSLNFFGKGYSSLQTFTNRLVDATRIRTSLSRVWNGQNSSSIALGYRINSVGQIPSYRVRDDRTNPLRATGEINENSYVSYVGDLQHKTYLGKMDAVLTAGGSFDLSPATYFARFLEIQRNDDGQYISFTDPDSSLTDYDVDLVSVGSFAQFEFTPLPRLRAVASVRYDMIKYDYDNHLPASAFSGALDGSSSYNRLSPKLGFTYDFGQGRGAYANASQGFIPPEVGELYRGVTAPTLQSATFNSYEVGGWTAFADGRIYVNGSAYLMDGRNEIVSVRLDDGSSENRNAGKTRHRGVEYAVVFTPSNQVSVRIGGTNARHEYIEYQDRGITFDGNQMNLAPKWIANAEVTVRPSFLPGARFGIEWQHLGEYFMNPENTEMYDGFDLIFLRAGYELKGIQLWINLENLTDELYANTAEKTAFGHSYTPGTPRNLVFGLGYKFGSKR